ncbi:Vacuolar protein sorting-associated protein 37A [Borealophlyctis nickersoniae]|nr:Vacuolar protein sorting-associated protein 37A [Borealophlyctis nickersoniae]
MKQVHRELLIGNEGVARRNLAKEAEMEALKASLAEQHALMRAERSKFEELLQAHQNESVRFAPDYIISRLRTSIHESEELSESIAQSFLEGKTGPDDFLKQYRETRKVYHMRAAKLERVAGDPGVLAPS